MEENKEVEESYTEEELNDALESLFFTGVQTNDKKVSNIRTNEEEVENAVNKMGKTTSGGLDGVSMRAVRSLG